MAGVLVQEAQSTQIPVGHAEPQDSGCGSADSLPRESNRAPQGADYYLTEGLEGVEVQGYRGTRSFMTAINLQVDQLHAGNAGQYAVFSHLIVPRLRRVAATQDVRWLTTWALLQSA